VRSLQLSNSAFSASNAATRCSKLGAAGGDSSADAGLSAASRIASYRAIQTLPDSTFVA
jgi:hypothetical protein